MVVDDRKLSTLANDNYHAGVKEVWKVPKLRAERRALPPPAFAVGSAASAVVPGEDEIEYADGKRSQKAPDTDGDGVVERPDLASASMTACALDEAVENVAADRDH